MGAVEQNRFPEDIILKGRDGNRILDQILGNDGGQWKFVDWDGVLRNVDTGATVSSNNYSHIFKSTIGRHIAVLLAATSKDATPSSANSVLLIQDAAISIGAGAALRLYNAAGTNFVEFDHSETDDILRLADGLWIDGALGVGITPSGLAAGDVLANGDLQWRSSTSFIMRLEHAATAARVITFQDLAGTVALLGAANGGHLLFVDNTYDIGASGATRPRNLYLSGLAVFGGGLTLSGHLLFTADATYDIGASGATRPRSIYLSTAAIIGTNPASAGTVRIPSAGSVRSRNNANSGDVTMIATNSSDQVDVGATGTRTNLLGTVVAPTIDPPTVDGQVTNESQIKSFYTGFVSGGVLGDGYKYNVSTAVRNSAGSFTITWSRAFATAFYNIQVSYEHSATDLMTRISARTASTVTVVFRTTAGVATDPDGLHVTCAGTLS